MIFPFEEIKKLMDLGMSESVARQVMSNMALESKKQQLMIDIISDLPIESTNEGDLVLEKLTGRMYINSQGEFQKVFDPDERNTQLAGAAVHQGSLIDNKIPNNPLKGKGNSYGAHVSSTWGNGNGHKPDYDISRDLIGGKDWF